MRRAARATLGPVSDLERHLPSEWWRSLFDAVYLKTDGDVVEDHALTRSEVDAIVAQAGLARTDRVLDLCCGQGRHTLELARRGFGHVLGMDRSRYLVRLARRRARGEELPVRFREGDARKVGSLREVFDAVLILGNSFGYFEAAEEDARVLQGVRKVLAPGGVLYLDLSDGAWLREHFEARSWEWIDADHFVCRERSLAADGRRLISREVVVHAEQGVIADQFYAERLYTPAQIEELLGAAGFVDVQLHETFETSSARNQDLGMMAHRLRLSAKAPAARAPTGPRAVPYPEVTVLLGDPRRPDAVKREGHFSEDDLETVRRMREALATLPGYRFEVVDDHAQLLGQLRRAPPAFVLNLCDEGFDNDARKELHVPALLEVLGVPYTGAGPSCLGLCYDKGLVRAVAEALDVPVPMETFLGHGDHAGTIPSVFPAMIKPALGDSSVGITEQSVVHTPTEAVEAVARLRIQLPDVPILVQEYLTGVEYTVGLVGNPSLGFQVLPVLEVDYDDLPEGLPHILSYASKWDNDSPYVTRVRYVEARAGDEVLRPMIDASMRLFERLGCRDYARFDWRTDANGEVKLLEVNPNPGWCWDGKLAMMAELQGSSYADLLRWILEAAQTRIQASRS
ncbi:MAG: methyltransferase domain-containing protein [Alphaproteobacteria bacterium]|nr:methyltransferase domain-containing protein [Alphaproteobacteria bacterium]